MKIGWNKSWKAIFSLVALATLVVTPQTAQADAVTDVSAGELSGMQQLYAIEGQSGDAFSEAYTTDNSGSIATGSFTRVGYYFQVQRNASHPQGAGPLQWAWASMDTFNTDPTLVGVPRAGTGIVENGTLVSNLNIESNHPDLAALNGQTGQNGIIEFWSSNYNANGGGAFGSNDGLFDWKDSGGSTGGGHGSFQVFHLAGTPPLFADGSGTTLFGITSNGGLGVGTGTTANSPDWTFGPNEGTYDVKNLEIWVGTPLVVPEPSSLALALLGLVGVGCCCWRRRRLFSCRKFGVAMAMAMSCLLATSVNAQVVNGNFEDTSNGGLGTGAWVLEDAAVFNNGGFGGSTPSLVSQDAGTRLMTLQQGNNGGRIAQDVPTTPGSFYELSFYHNNLDGGGVQNSGVQSVTWSVGPLGSEIVGPSNFAYPDYQGAGQITYGWTQETEIFQAAAATTRIAFQGTPDSNGGFWGIQLDAVSLTETTNPVPEPSAMVLGCFVAVSAVVFGWRRRRRRVA